MMNSERINQRRARWAVSVAALLLAVPIYFYFERSPTQQTTPREPLYVPESASDTIDLEATAPVSQSAEQEAAAADAVALWQSIDEASVAELPAYKEVVQDRVLIQVLDVASNWQVGQRIAIFIPQLDQVYTPVVERIETGLSGTRSYVGNLTVANGRAHRFTITIGPRNTFAHLSTPRGTYELVATGDLGWLMPTINMDRHVDYSEPDFVVPEGPLFRDP